MKIITLTLISLTLWTWGIAQKNLLRNSSFEGDSATNAAVFGQNFSIITPPEWEDYISESAQEEMWFSDFGCGIGQDCINFQKGIYFINCSQTVNSPNAKCDTSISQTCKPMKASHGRFYIGMNFGKGFKREGIQQKLLNDCQLNSGDYKILYRLAVPYNCDNKSFFVYLSRKKNRLSRRLSKEQVKIIDMNVGKWQTRKVAFSLDYGKKKDRNLKWLVITHREGLLSNDQSKYIFLDNVRLTRPCDAEFVCYPSLGQICPQIALNVPQSNPLIIKNLENATDINIEITSGSGANITDFQAHNENGLPDIYWPDSSTISNIAGGTYNLKITIKNECGGIVEKRKILINQPSYPLAIDFVDSTANWSKVPEPCCLQDLVLENETLIGNLNYIVKGKIIIGDSVSILPGSNIYFQAEEVVNIQNLDTPFGANLLIDLVPCN